MKQTSINQQQNFRNKKLQYYIRSFPLLLFATILVLIILFPLFLALRTSVMPAEQVAAYPPIFIPKSLTFKNYINVFKSTEFGYFVFNTFKLGIITICLVLPIASLASFALSRYNFIGKKLIRQLFLLLYMFPIAFLVLPFYLQMFRMNLVNTHLGLCITYITFSLPLAVWVLTPFFDTVPRVLDDAAAIDGCSKIRVLTKIILPVSMPGVAAVSVFTFMGVWSEYMWGITLIDDEIKRTIVPGISAMMGSYAQDIGLIMAAVTLSCFIPFVLFFVVQRFLVEALTAGAVKG
jgi:multiple sugar transport system permease protein